MALEVEKMASGNTAGVNKPSSGTYGEKADVERLKASLPSSGAAPAAGQQLPPMSDAPVRPQPSLRPPTVANLPPGVPGVLAAPTGRPYEPVDTLPTSPVAGAVVNDAQSRLRLLDILANSPQVSEETREWAQRVLHALTS